MCACVPVELYAIVSDAHSKLIKLFYYQSDLLRFYATKMISCMILGFAVCIAPIMIMMFIKVANRIPPKVRLLLNVKLLQYQ